MAFTFHASPDRPKRSLEELCRQHKAEIELLNTRCPELFQESPEAIELRRQLRENDQQLKARNEDLARKAVDEELRRYCDRAASARLAD